MANDGQSGANGPGTSGPGTNDPVAGSYAGDIQPKFRPGDITCMARRHILLNDPAWMCDPTGSTDFADHANARRVYAALSDKIMPPDGPWPQDWLDTYQNWIDTGFQP
jgi:hypothetical protein